MPGIRTRESLASNSRRRRNASGASSEDDDEGGVTIVDTAIIGSNDEEQDEDDEDLGSLISDDDAIPNAPPPIDDAAPLPRGEDGYNTGAIRSIYMKNFVTYSEATFECGPSLNMIIGPNGTGKSSVVCAIALGLGFPPRVLGRDKDVASYIKTGTNGAIIEIKLEGVGGRPIVVRSSIEKGGKSGKTTFRLNGKPTTQKKIKALMRHLNIQVDNLCQFLPQDQVVEFAKMDPVKLLEATQKAVCDPEVLKWHQQLIELGAASRKLADDTKTQQGELVNKLSRQSAAEEDVRKIRDKQKHEHRAETLRKLLPMFEYNLLKQRADAARAELHQAKQEEKELKDELAPALVKIKSKKTYATKIQSERNHAKLRIKSAKDTITAINSMAATLKEKMTTCDAEIETEMKLQKKKKEDVVRSKNAIARYEAASKEPPPEFDAVSMNQKIREHDSQIAGLKIQHAEMTAQMREKLAAVDNKNQQLRRYEHELQGLKTASGQLLRKLQAVSPDSVKAVEWLEKNKSLFKGEVYGPPLITCSIKNRKIADAVESAIGQGDFLTFTVTNKEDFQTLTHHLLSRNENCLSLSDIHVKQASKPIGSLQTQTDQATLQSLGFDGWLIDALEGPEPVLVMLAEACGLHRTAFTTGVQSDAQFQRAQASPINRWATGDTLYITTTRREYNQSSTSTTSLRKARFWVDTLVDTSQESELNRSILEVKYEIDTIREEGRSIQEQRKTFDAEMRELVEKRDDLKAEKERLQKERSDFENVVNMIATENTKLATIQESQQEIIERIVEKRRAKEEHALKRVEQALLLPNAIRLAKRRLNEYFDAQLRLIEAESDVAAFEAQNKSIVERLKILEDTTKRCTEEFQRSKDRARKMGQVALNLTNELSEEEIAIVDDYKDEDGKYNTDLNDINNEIETLFHRAALLGGGNIRTIEQYERRAAEIEALKARIDGMKGELNECKEAISEIRGQWEPCVERAVRQISAAFEGMFEYIGCVGEVLLGKDEEDFSQWRILNMISFHQGEAPSLLTDHRQSGGERAVATSFYLMSLQSLARAPFRVVDEINQGMDQQNERMVHSLMVRIACAENTSQYFLITPKLLDNLKYHPRMKVHIIYSGNNMPSAEQQTTKLDLPALANLALRVRGCA